MVPKLLLAFSEVCIGIDRSEQQFDLIRRVLQVTRGI